MYAIVLFNLPLLNFWCRTTPSLSLLERRRKNTPKGPWLRGSPILLLTLGGGLFDNRGSIVAWCDNTFAALRDGGCLFFLLCFLHKLFETFLLLRKVHAFQRRNFVSNSLSGRLNLLLCRFIGFVSKSFLFSRPSDHGLELGVVIIVALLLFILDSLTLLALSLNPTPMVSLSLAPITIEDRPIIEVLKLRQTSDQGLSVHPDHLSFADFVVLKVQDGKVRQFHKNFFQNLAVSQTIRL